jgi:hypothetical protein
MDKRIEMIRKLVSLNDAEINAINKVASQSRRKMGDADRKRCIALRKSNTWLRKVEFEIIQALVK